MAAGAQAPGLLRDPLVRFATSFAGLVILAEATYHLVLPGSAGLATYRDAVAQISGALLNVLGREVRITANAVHSARFALNVTHECDALRICAVLGAGFIAAPIPWRRRLAGAALGILWLQTLNLLRIVSLFVIGEDSWSWFRIIHEDVWPLAFIASVLVAWTLCFYWSPGTKGRCVRRRPKPLLVFAIQVASLVYLASWLPSARSVYPLLFHQQAKAVFGGLGQRWGVHFVGARNHHDGVDTQMTGLEKGRLPRWRATFGIHERGFWPLIAVAAMIIATPIPLGRRLLALVMGLVLVNLFTLAHTGVIAFAFYGLAAAIEAGDPGIWPRVVAAARGSFDSIFARYAVVLAAWALTAEPHRSIDLRLGCNAVQEWFRRERIATEADG